jgi:hypothetical protein
MSDKPWYEDLPDDGTLEDLLELKDTLTREVYFKAIDDKVAAVQKAVDAGIIPEAEKANRENAVKTELALKQKWFTIKAIAYRLETQYPVALRQVGGTLYTHPDGRTMLAGEILTNVIKNPESMSASMADVLETDLELPDGYLERFRRPGVPYTEEQEVSEEESAQESSVEEPETSTDDTTCPYVTYLYVTNKVDHNMVARVSKTSDNRIIIELLPDKQPENAINTAHLLKPAYRYTAGPNPEPSYETVEFVI